MSHVKAETFIPPEDISELTPEQHRMLAPLPDEHGVLDEIGTLDGLVEHRVAAKREMTRLSGWIKAADTFFLAETVRQGIETKTRRVATESGSIVKLEFKGREFESKVIGALVQEAIQDVLDAYGIKDGYKATRGLPENIADAIHKLSVVNMFIKPSGSVRIREFTKCEKTATRDRITAEVRQAIVDAERPANPIPYVTVEKFSGEVE